MAAGGTVRICVSDVCRKAPANTPIFINEQHFTQRRIAHQTRSVVIAASNHARCMHPAARTPDPSRQPRRRGGHAPAINSDYQASVPSDPDAIIG